MFLYSAGFSGPRELGAGVPFGFAPKRKIDEKRFFKREERESERERERDEESCVRKRRLWCA